MAAKQPFVYPEMRMVFVLLVLCFAAWGVAANMTDPLVKVFSKIFTMSQLQSALVQFAYYGAYFCLALPAAFETNLVWSVVFHYGGSESQRFAGRVINAQIVAQIFIVMANRFKRKHLLTKTIACRQQAIQALISADINKTEGL